MYNIYVKNLNRNINKMNNKFLVFLCSMLIVVGCKENKQNKKISENLIQKEVTEQDKPIVVNPNVSFSGAYKDRNIILNLNVDSKDSISGILYKYKDVDPYKNLLPIKGIKIGNQILLSYKDSLKIKGAYDDFNFNGELISSSGNTKIRFERLKNYSNGNLIVKFGGREEKISLAGFTNDEICQGELTEISTFSKKSGVVYKVFYFVFPSTGIYKARGNCGSGQESLIAILKTQINDNNNINTDIVDLASCYNAIEVELNGENIIPDSLIKYWNRDKRLEIKKNDLRKDTSNTIVIDSSFEDIIKVY